eukprot:1185934-Prorocentrum_minimum.AAC.3
MASPIVDSKRPNAQSAVVLPPRPPITTPKPPNPQTLPLRRVGFPGRGPRTRLGENLEKARVSPWMYGF